MAQYKTSFPEELKIIMDKYLDYFPEYKNAPQLMHFAVMKHIRETKPELFEELKKEVEKNINRPLPDMDLKPLINRIEKKNMHITK